MAIENLSLIVPEELSGKRLDQVLAILCPQHSRSRLQGWIKSENITVDGKIPRQRDIVKGGESICIHAEFNVQNDNWKQEDIPLEILYKDNDILVINKPPGLVVHPGAGNPEHTLLNALLFYCPELAQVPRAGIIQRLDKDTSGLMVVAKSPVAHTCLVDQLQKRQIKREYEAIVYGQLTAGGTIDAPIGRHPVQRKRMAVVEHGKQSVTHYRIIKRYKSFTHLKVKLESGRTHQIRVHMSYINHPIIGDPVYGNRRKFPKNISAALREKISIFPRQALHASSLGLKHPVSGKELSWSAPLHHDIKDLLWTIGNEECK